MPFVDTDCRTEFSYNGEYLMVLEKTARRVQIFHVNNANLRLEGEDCSAVTFLHPLGSLERIYEGDARDALWNKQSLE